MRFASHANRAKYVIAGHPRRRVEASDGSTYTNPGLEARFLNNAFDTERAQRDKGWTDEQRQIVENYLLSHPDFDKPGGFYLDLATSGKSKAEILREAGHPMADQPVMGNERCMFFFSDPDVPGAVAQCPATKTEGDYCAEHQPEHVTDEQGPAPEPVQAAPEPEPVGAGWKMPPIGG